MSRPELPHFEGPYDWVEIDGVVRDQGGVVLDGFLRPPELVRLNREIDAHLGANEELGRPKTGSEMYDLFLGHRTIRLHGLIEKFASVADLIGRAELIEWAARMLHPVAESVLLNAGELIQIQPGEPAQFLHRDSDSWPLPIGDQPLVVNAIVGLDDLTLENGATHVAPGSWGWDRAREAKPGELARAVMNAGDAVLLRGDLLHGGGENRSEARRRALSLSYCAGWLRPVENSFLNLGRDTVRALSPRLQAVLGYAAYDGGAKLGGLLGLYENGDPTQALTRRVSA